MLGARGHCGPLHAALGNGERSQAGSWAVETKRLRKGNEAGLKPAQTTPGQEQLRVKPATENTVVIFSGKTWKQRFSC